MSYRNQNGKLVVVGTMQHLPNLLDQRVSVALIIGVPACSHEDHNGKKVDEDLIGGLHIDL